MLPVLLTLLLSSQTTTPPPPTTPKTAERRLLRVAVNDLVVTDVDPRTARVVAESLVYELRKLERMNVISFDEVRQMLNLESEKQALGCTSNEECLAQIADALGVDYLVTGTLAKVGDTHVFSLKLLNQTEASAQLSVNKVVPAGSGVEFLGEIGPAVETLFPDVPLRKGETRGISPELARRLTPPPLSPVIFWSTAAVSGALLVGSGVAGLMQVVFQSDYKDTVTRAKSGLESGAALVEAGQNAQTAELAGWILLGSGVVVGGLAAAMAPLTDFQGVGAEP